MKRILVTLLVLVGAVGLAVGQTVVGSDHDLRSWGSNDDVCGYCHFPHQATAAAGQDPLWNHTLQVTASYGVYGSDTMNAAPTDIGGQAVGSASVSFLCMSCHDGTVAIQSLYKTPHSAPSGTDTITGSALIGTDMSDDHPINFTYDTALATADGDLVSPSSSMAVDAAGEIPLFGGTVQCASCHDPHDNNNEPFLRKTNVASALCSSCHQK